MPKRNEHLVVILLEPARFNVEFEVWPQHITIVPWFPCDDEDRLDKILRAVAVRHKSFEVTAGKTEDWGREDRFQVITLNDYLEQLKKLHLDIFESLENNGFPIHQKDFLGEKYRPHVTLRNNLQKNERQIWEGQSIKVVEFSLISQVRLKRSGRVIKRVKKNYELAQ